MQSYADADKKQARKEAVDSCYVNEVDQLLFQVDKL